MSWKQNPHRIINIENVNNSKINKFFCPLVDRVYKIELSNVSGYIKKKDIPEVT